MDNNRKTMNKREIFMGHAYVFLFFFLTTVDNFGFISKFTVKE